MTLSIFKYVFFKIFIRTYPSIWSGKDTKLRLQLPTQNDNLISQLIIKLSIN